MNEERMQVYEELSSILSLAWSRVEWRRITSMKRTALDIFTDRIRAAASEPDVVTAIERLCKLLGISSINPEPDAVRAIMARNDEAMHAMRENAIYLAVLSKEKAKAKYAKEG
ncbi:MAG TPA: hypothetical protein PLJ11_04450 [Methanomassiliicoccales archaeon]|nr:hypothetical protein [Methanomassiliicoccales archaeon]